MSISIYSSSSLHISINLLEIAIGIIQQSAKDEDYLIDIHLDLVSFFEDYIGQKLYIVDNAYIVEESSLKYSFDDEDGFHEENLYEKVIPFSQTVAMDLLEGIIRRGLNNILLEKISIIRNGTSISFNISLGEFSIEEYKNSIIELIDKQISKLELLYTQESIENDIWSKIYNLSKKYNSNIVRIALVDLLIPRVSKDNVNFNNVDIGWFRISLYKNTNDLILYKLILLGKIDSFEYVSIDTINIFIKKEVLDFFNREDNEISFNEANATLFIKGVEYKLEKGMSHYKVLRELLLDNGSRTYSANELLEILSIRSDGPYEYIKQAKSDIKKKYGNEVAKLINIKSKVISLNKK